jgi:hypothetical protein
LNSSWRKIISLSLSRTIYRNVTRYTTPPRKIKGKKFILFYLIFIYLCPTSFEEQNGGKDVPENITNHRK